MKTLCRALALLLLSAAAYADVGAPAGRYIQSRQTRQANTAVNIDSGTVAEIRSSTITVIPPNNTYGGGFDAAEGTQPPGQVGVDVVWADSGTHTINNIPDNGPNHVLVMSSVTVVPGHLMMWSATGKAVDFGPPPWVMVPSTFTWNLNFPLIVNSTFTFQGSSATLVMPGLSFIHVSTETISYEYFDFHLSTANVGYLYANSVQGTSGYLITSAGPNQPVAWSPTGCISKTRAQIQAITPGRLGECYFCSDCTTAVNCVSSGTASSNQFYSSASRAAGCQ